MSPILRGVAHLAAVMPGARYLLSRAAVAPVRVKSEHYCRVASAIAARCRPASALVQSNMGLSDTLRLSLPAAKHDLLFGRPEQHVAERATLDLVRLLARRSAAFIDVGANEGLYSFAVSTDAGGSGRPSIHAFEPDNDVFARLAHNVETNHAAIHLTNAAVSDRIGRQTFHRNVSDDSSGSLTNHFSGKHDTVAVDVETTTLAHYLTENDIQHACVKVDVEGAGCAVWDGLSSAADRVDWLVMEIIGPEAEAELPRRIISETGWRAYYIRDYELVRSQAGEFTYKAPFYNWLFTRLDLPDLPGFVLQAG